jgi:hypothetical protein
LAGAPQVDGAGFAGGGAGLVVPGAAWTGGAGVGEPLDGLGLDVGDALGEGTGDGEADGLAGTTAADVCWLAEAGR